MGGGIERASGGSRRPAVGRLRRPGSARVFLRRLRAEKVPHQQGRSRRAGPLAPRPLYARPRCCAPRSPSARLLSAPAISTCWTRANPNCRPWSRSGASSCTPSSACSNIVSPTTAPGCSPSRSLLRRPREPPKRKGSFAILQKRKTLQIKRESRILRPRRGFSRTIYSNEGNAISPERTQLDFLRYHLAPARIAPARRFCGRGNAQV